MCMANALQMLDFSDDCCVAKAVKRPRHQFYVNSSYPKQDNDDQSYLTAAVSSNLVLIEQQFPRRQVEAAATAASGNHVNFGGANCDDVNDEDSTDDDDDDGGCSVEIDAEVEAEEVVEGIDQNDFSVVMGNYKFSI